MVTSQRFRALLSMVLAIATVFVVGCSAATPPAPPLYSPDQINLIGQYESDLESLQSRLDELPELIAANKWSDIQSLIHGPLGELRLKMLTVASKLSSSDQSKARDLTGDVFKYLVDVDAAAKEQNREQALFSYSRLVDSYEKFIETLPR